MIPLVIWLLFTISIEGSLVNINEVAKPCIEDSNCPQNRSCKLGFCKNPCLEVCNSEAICVVVKHKPYCFCKEDNDDCIPEKISCVPQCEKNSVCNTDIGYCECKSGYQGNPYRGCSKKCTSDSNCHSDETCINGKCRSPCEEDCGVNSICEVADHTSLCDCLPGFAGNAFEMCWPIRMAFLLTRDKICQQCGINAECNTINGRTFCHCQKGFRGNPYLSCQKMCKTNSDCPADRICGDQLCRDPCEEACGVNTICEVQNRKPKCSCQKGFSGDPTRICTMSLGNRFADSEEELDCHPKCGDNATCDTEHGICVCKLNFFGNPYGGCRKKCGVDSDCSKDEACIENDCKNPCLEACGKNALCAVNNHEPICSCPRGFSGDPLKICRENVVTQPTIVEVDLCDTLKCGAKAECKIEETEICKCLPGYLGNPYIGCFKKCATNLECSNEDLCSNGTCENACKNSCGINAICKADKHKPQCSCPAKYKGDPHKICFPDKEGVLSNPSKVPCLKCICRAITGKDDIFACARKSISFGYWAFAGEDLVGGEDFRTRNATVDFITCMNNRICILNTMNDYIHRALHRMNDIDCDEKITCADNFAAHKFGLTAKFADSTFNAAEAKSFDQCEGHGEKDISNDWNPRSCIGPSYVELLS